MNKKLIVAAVAASLAPVASQAEVTVYGRINNAVDLADLSADLNPDGTKATDTTDGTTNISSIASRFGFRGDTNLGNGLRAHGRYEFSVVADRENASNDSGGTSDLRIAKAGVSGAFGRVDIGQMWSAYNKTFGTFVSPTYTLGYYLYSAVGGGAFRASNTIQYTNTFGPLNLVFDVRLNGETESGTAPDTTAGSTDSSDVAEKLSGTGFGIGLTYPVLPNLTVAFAYDVESTTGEHATAKVLAQEITNAGDGIHHTVTSTAFGDAVDETRIGLSANYTNVLGYGINVSGGFQSFAVDGDIALSGTTSAADNTSGAAVPAGTTAEIADVTSLFLYVSGDISENTSWLAGYSSADNGREVGQYANEGESQVAATGDATQLTWGVYHNVGGGLRLYYEATSVSAESNNYDGERHLLGIRVDF